MNPSPRILAPVGLAEADVAALAALLPQVAERAGPWCLGDAARADLLLVDLESTDGVIAQAEALIGNVACIAVDQPGGLARPFVLDALVRVLDGVVGRDRPPAADPAGRPASSVVPAHAPPATVAAPPVLGPIARGSLQFGLADADADGEISFEELYSPDLIDRIPDGNAVESATPAAPATADTGRDTEAVREESATQTTPIAADTSGPGTAGAGVAASVGATGAAEPEARTAPLAPPTAAEAAGRVLPKAAYPLIEYLTGTLIGLPSRIAPPGLPPLVIDPQARVFHAEGDLEALAPYHDLPLPRTQWLAVMPSQLAAIRQQIPARPYALLAFHHALRQAGRRLAPHLDPGGSYALKEGLPLGGDLPRVGRVLAVLGAPGGPRGLAEVASQSTTSVVEVYAVVSALDAIGLLIWTPRRRAGAR